MGNTWTTVGRMNGIPSHRRSLVFRCPLFPLLPLRKPARRSSEVLIPLRGSASYTHHPIPFSGSYQGFDPTGCVPGVSAWKPDVWFLLSDHTPSTAMGGDLTGKRRRRAVLGKDIPSIPGLEWMRRGGGELISTDEKGDKPSAGSQKSPR